MTSEMRALRQAIARITLLSQVAAVNLDQNGSRSTDEDIGGRRPPGGIIRKDDFAEGYPLKSAEYFTRRLARCHTERAVTELLAEAEATLEAWKRAPVSDAVELERDSFLWRCTIADDPRPIKEIQKFYTVSRSSVNRYRKSYRGVRQMISQRKEAA